jgi:hypothetical protein
MNGTTDDTSLVWWSLPWWTCVFIIAGMIVLNVQLFLFRRDSNRDWFEISNTFRGIWVEAELQRERDEHRGRQHPGDRRIPGEVEPGWTPLGQPQQPLTEPDPENED